jgi:hypothetical protein
LDVAPFDPGFAPPVESLNAQPAIDVHSDTPQQQEMPKTNNGSSGDTPSLNLPTNGHPLAPQPPPANGAITGPPPMPPPLMPFGAPPAK